MISYCVAVLRPGYTQRLVDELVERSSAPYEILLWLNVADPDLDAFLDNRIARGCPIRVVGRTPENVGMRAYRDLFRAARHPLLVQIDDDVVGISRGIAERADRIFREFPKVRQLVADVWQDEFTTGARPPLTHYRCVHEREGLYAGPIDGWFSIYHRSILPVLLSLPYSQYCPLGALTRHALQRWGLHGLLCTRMKVFHVIGPQYASLFGMLDSEVEKYRRLGRLDIVDWYLGAKPSLPPIDELQRRFTAARQSLDQGNPEPAGDPAAGPSSELSPGIRSSETALAGMADGTGCGILGVHWRQCGPVDCRETDGTLLLRGTGDWSPGSERGLVSTRPHDGVTLAFEVFIPPGACFIAKINQVAALDQTTNSYHVYCDGRTAYLARHHHVFGPVAVERGTWESFRLTHADGVLCLHKNDRLLYRIREGLLSRGYAFLGAKAGEVHLRNLRLGPPSLDQCSPL